MNDIHITKENIDKEHICCVMSGRRRGDNPAARSFAGKYGCVLVLKGPGTITASPDGRVFVNTSGNPGMAKGGSGDVLAGMIAGLCAQGLSPFDAARCGVYLHGAAADLCAKRLSMQGMLPEDILHDIHTLFIENERHK